MSVVFGLVVLSCAVGTVVQAQAILPVPPVICPIDACPTVQHPVCGLLYRGGQYIYRSFGNSCKLNRYNCQNPSLHYVQKGPTGLSCEVQKLANRCSAACTFDFRPVCGRQTNREGVVIYKSFGNACGFWNAVCEKEPWVQVGKDGQSCECLGLNSTCSAACLPVYWPQCGLLQVGQNRIYNTFNSDCDLLKFNCEQPLLAFKRVGVAGKTCAQLSGGGKDRCATACDRSYFPLCAVRTIAGKTVQYQTFDNLCLLVKQNCDHNEFRYRVAPNGVGKTCQELGLKP